MKTLPLNSAADVTILYQNESVELKDIGFTGTYIEEEPTGPTASCGGEPGHVECNVELDDSTMVQAAVETWFDDHEMFEVVVDSSVEELVVEAITNKVLEDPEAYT